MMVTYLLAGLGIWIVEIIYNCLYDDGITYAIDKLKTKDLAIWIGFFIGVALAGIITIIIWPMELWYIVDDYNKNNF